MTMWRTLLSGALALGVTYVLLPTLLILPQAFRSDAYYSHRQSARGD